jgi:23S rRNA pseudouridine1911/1915/1917 synthase
VPEATAPRLEHEEVPLRIAYEDDAVLVVDKPAGVVVHPSPGHASGTLVHGLVGLAAGGEDEERPGIVHRIDRDTSGLLVVARSDEAYERLQELVRGHELERRYKAPRAAVTHFEVERLFDRHALLDVWLETGRTHQIRVHLAAIGLPVVGDVVYGVPDEHLKRQFLHAWRLAFPHPLRDEQVDVESPLPPDLQAALARFAS